jgi:heptosyltransferase-3
VLVASPVFSVLKAHAPQAEVDALVYADTAEMLTLHPAIAQVHVIDRKWKQLGIAGQAKAELALLKVLKARGYDLVIHLTEHWRGAWLCRLLKPRWAVGPSAVDRGGLWRHSFTHIVPGSKGLPLRHTVETNLDALRRVGIQPAADERCLILVPGLAAEKAVSQHLAGFGLCGGDFIHIHPASRWFFKCWPVERMAALVAHLQGEGHTVVLTAAPSEKEKAMIDAIQARLERPAFNLSGQLSLKELAALAKAAKLFVGVDSAPMHIASAVRTPVVALFGPSGEKRWGPWGVPHRVVASTAHPCRPCDIDGCGGGKLSDCLATLTVDEVLDAVHQLLA